MRFVLESPSERRAPPRALLLANMSLSANPQQPQKLVLSANQTTLLLNPFRSYRKGTNCSDSKGLMVTQLGPHWRELQNLLLSISAALVVSTRTALQQRQATRSLPAEERTSAKASKALTGLKLRWKRLRKRTAGGQQQGHHFLHFGGGAKHAAKQLAQQGLDCEKALDLKGAISAFEEVNKLVPGNSHYLAMLSKQWSDQTYVPGTSDSQARDYNSKAVAYSQQAIEVDPQYSLAYIAACVSKGRLALYSDNRTKVALAKEAREDAYTALQRDPTSDLAHHLLGRWHYEMAQLGWPVRTIIRMMYGTALSPGTHQGALEAYQKAMELNPKRLVHRVELGRVHMKLGQYPQALKQLEAALQLEVEDINAHCTKLDAYELLETCRKHTRPSHSTSPLQQLAVPT